MSTNPRFIVARPFQGVVKFCASVDCFTQLTEKQIRNGYKYCSRLCASHTNFLNYRKLGAQKSGEKSRGSNLNRHIMIRVNGQRVYLHRHVVESQIGCKLASDEIVHHLDRNRHRNCFWKNMCEVCQQRGYPNLEVVVGHAAHVIIHQHDMQRGKRKRK